MNDPIYEARVYHGTAADASVRPRTQGLADRIIRRLLHSPGNSGKTATILLAPGPKSGFLP